MATKEKWKVFENVFDEFALRNLFKLSSEGHFDELESPVSIGKESNVFTAKKGKGRIIVKIYRLETCDFRRMYDYIKYDSRYFNIKKQKRSIVFAWTQREYRNLVRAREAGVSVPLALTFKYNILLLEYIGDSVRNEIALRVKDKLPKYPKKFFKEVIENMKRLHKAGFVHGDLSEFNILNLNEKPVFIDFSQALQLDSSIAEELLERDVRNICNFFKRLGLKVDVKKIYDEIRTSGAKTES
ncbi:serine protein kinase RIO [Candidatus Woesearchaeota archaeon]|nr:serine protein kinase RIO [Candidatus Woesearchaeota archaeon]